MIPGINFIVIVVLIIAVWIIIEFKRVNHKILAIFLVLLIIFTYLSFSYVTRNKEVDLKTIPGIIDAGGLYFSWLGGIFRNIRSVTSYAIKKDWRNINNETLEKTPKLNDSIWEKI